MRNDNLSSRFTFACFLLFLLAGLHPEQGKSGEKTKLDIVTSLFPQYDFAKRIGGEKATVRMLLPPGVDPHAFDPKPSDLAGIAKADLFVYTGADMEPWAEKLIDALDDSGTIRAIDVSAGMEFIKANDHDGDEEEEDQEGGHHESEHGEDGHEEHGHIHALDPHVWLDPILAIAMVDNLLKAMCEADSDNASFYTANAEALKEDLRKLDSECREMVADAKRRVLVFGGKFAFAYFTKRYGLEHIGAYDSCGSGAEPSLKRVLEITAYVEKEHIPVIYHEEFAEPRISSSIANTTGCRTIMAHSLHNLSAAEFASGISFMDLMRRNVAVFAEGLR